MDGMIEIPPEKLLFGSAIKREGVELTGICLARDITYLAPDCTHYMRCEGFYGHHYMGFKHVENL